jgi:hypothetical protein
MPSSIAPLDQAAGWVDAEWRARARRRTRRLDGSRPGESVGEDIWRPFITIGFATWLSMLPLAITSTTGWSDGWR